MTTLLLEPRPDRLRPRRYPVGVPAASTTIATAGAHPFADADGLRRAYDEHGPLVYGICRKALDEHTANDVTQEVFISAWRARNRFDPSKGTVAAWLVGITKRRIIDQLRAEGRHVDRRAATDERPDQVADADVQRTVDRMVVAEALRALPERTRDAVLLAFVHELTHHEIAERTGTPLGTVKSDIRRGLQRIKEHLETIHD